MESEFCKAAFNLGGVGQPIEWYDIAEFIEGERPVRQEEHQTQRPKDFERKGNHWLELMRNWIIEANQAENLSKQENPSRMRDFLVSIGSNRRLAAGILLADFKTPWNFLAETNAEATSSANLNWWTTSVRIGTRL